MYDGDEMNVVFLLDNWMADKAENFAPYVNIISTEYYTINNYLFLPPPMVATISNYMIHKDKTDHVDKDPVYDKILKLDKQ